MSWRDFFDGDSSSYVNARHKTLHADISARAIIPYVKNSTFFVLDYGCGEALASDVLSSHCAKLFLYDLAPTIQQKLATRYAQSDAIVPLNDSTFEALPNASLDMIVIVSVLQYIGEAEITRLLDTFAQKLKPDGRLLIGDVVPPNLSLWDDARALLSFGWQGGFLLAAIIGLIKTALSDYSEIRGRFGITQFNEADMLRLLRENGFVGERAARNIGHNPWRMTFLARPDQPRTIPETSRP